MAITPTLDEAKALAKSRSEVTGRQRARIFTWLSGAWVLALTWWISTNYTKLRVAKTLIERKDGSPLTSEDHLSFYPELYAEFDALGLLGQGTIEWTFVLTAFAIVGVTIAIGVGLTEVRSKRSVLVVMGAVWWACVALAIANGETLELLMWLNN